MSQLLADLRHSLRQWRRKPGFALVALLTLALGIGANAAIFSVVDAVLLDPLPYRDAERLVLLHTDFPNLGFDKFWVSPPEYLEIREWATSYDAVGAYDLGSENVTGGDRPLQAEVAYVSEDLWRVLGSEPLHGRVFTAEEDRPGVEPVVVLSHDFWRRTFGADEKLLGNTIEVGGVARTVVGVLGPEVDLEDAGIEVWLPLALDEADPGGRGSHGLLLVGRLAEGVSVEQAKAELPVLMDRWEREFPETHHPNPEGHNLRLVPLKEDLVGSVRPALMLLLATVGLVLLIACANVANLLLARAETRQREIAVRTALGADGGRLLRQFLTEALTLSLVGGAAGLAVATWGLKALVRTYPDSVPRLGDIALDGKVVAFTLGASLLTGVLFGLAPALHARTRSFFSTLRDGGRSGSSRGRRLFRGTLVVAEVALAALLVVGAGLLLKSFWTLMQVDPGFEAGGVLTFRTELPASQYPEGRQVAAFYDRLLTELEALPEVDSAAVAMGLVPLRSVNANDTQFEGLTRTDDGIAHNVDYYQAVSPGYFSTLDIEIEKGRGFAETDAAGGAPVVVINRKLAETFYPGVDPVGKRLRRGWWEGSDTEEPWYTIVGVAADVRQGGMDQEPGTELYFLHRQSPESPAGVPRGLHVLARTHADPLAAAPSVRRVMERLDPTLPLARLRSLEDVVSDAVQRPRFLSLLVSLFAALALVLAAVGTYGVLSYAVEQRRYEMGVRMALGAQSSDILWLVLRQGLVLVATGLAVGLTLAVVLRRALTGLLYGVEPTDPGALAAVAAVLATVALVACLVPAVKAMRTDPVRALSSE